MLLTARWTSGTAPAQLAGICREGFVHLCASLVKQALEMRQHGADPPDRVARQRRSKTRASMPTGSGPARESTIMTPHTRTST
jgi:hypothetical protein